MRIEEQLIVDIAAAIIFAAIGFVAARLWEKAKLMQRYGYIRQLLAGHERLQIIVPSVEVERFTFPTDAGEVVHESPRNVLFMPMPEGRAIAALISIFHKINPKLNLQLITANNHDPSVPTFSIGGPSVNPFSKRKLSADFPMFGIEYPAAMRAHYGGLIFETYRDNANMLTTDYGFIFITQTTQGAPCLVLCGILAFGTAMAVGLFGSLGSSSEAADVIRRARKGFIVAEGKVDGLEETAVSLSHWRSVPL